MVNSNATEIMPNLENETSSEEKESETQVQIEEENEESCFSLKKTLKSKKTV